MATTIIKSFQLSGTKKGAITVANVTEPYGAGSEAVVSVGVSLSGDIENPDWKAHIPYSNVDELIETLLEAKKSH